MVGKAQDQAAVAHSNGVADAERGAIPDRGIVQERSGLAVQVLHVKPVRADNKNGMPWLDSAVGNNYFITLFRAHRIDAVFDHVRLCRVSRAVDFKLEQSWNAIALQNEGVRFYVKMCSMRVEDFF